jgi:hypothetical protein
MQTNAAPMPPPPMMRNSTGSKIHHGQPLTLLSRRSVRARLGYRSTHPDTPSET